MPGKGNNFNGKAHHSTAGTVFPLIEFKGNTWLERIIPKFVSTYLLRRAGIVFC
jgi:hypothetical protein